MDIKNLLDAGANVQIVCNLADLKEVFSQWQDERDAMKPAQKEDVKLTADAAALQLGVTKISLWRWAKMGYLTPVKAGRKVFYWQSDIDTLLKKKEG